MTDERVEGLRLALEEAQVEGLLVQDAANIYYLSGFDGDTGWLLVGKERQFILSDSRFTLQMKQQAPDFEPVDTTGGAWKAIARTAKEAGLLPLGVEREKLTLAQYDALRKHLRKRDLKPVSGLVERLRARKTPDEIERIRAAAEIADRALLAALLGFSEEETEAELALKFELACRQSGAEGLSFPPIIAFGANAALPHYSPGKRRPRRGEVILCDVGAQFDHYASDMTRTYSWGAPEAEMAKIYRLVYEAQAKALEVIKPGVGWKVVDRAARDYIERAGYGEFFRHGLGHPVGLDVHDCAPPPVDEKQGFLLEEGMVMTVEPGIYLEGKGGVRLEQLVVVTADGCEILSRTPQPPELTPLEDVLSDLHIG